WSTASTLAQVIVTEQLSVANTLFVLKSQAGMVCGLHPRLMFVGHFVNTGVSVSTVQLFVWEQEAVLPHRSVAVQVDTRERRQPLVTVGKFVQVTCGLQLPVAVTL